MASSPRTSEDLIIHIDTGYSYSPQESSFSSPIHSHRPSLSSARLPLSPAIQQTPTSKISHNLKPAVPFVITPAPRRSRARAFSFLLDAPLIVEERGGDEDPFASSEYDNPFGTEEDDDDDDEEGIVSDNEEQGVEDAGTLERDLELLEAGGVRRKSYKRDSFQPLMSQELWWMGASACLVAGLTGLSVIVALTQKMNY